MSSAFPLKEPTRDYLRAKRVIDVTGSLTGIIILAPLFLLLAIAVLFSGRPVFFRQTRIGEGGRAFELLKFRTLHPSTDPYAAKPAGDAPGIGTIGRWLRASGLDELPQLLNVLRGDLTLVGPRPEMPFIVATYDVVERQRLLARPGLTGLWQISTSRDAPIHHDLEYDLFYLTNRRLLFDLWIIIRTPLVLLLKRPVRTDAAFLARWGRLRPHDEVAPKAIPDVSPSDVTLETQELEMA